METEVAQVVGPMTPIPSTIQQMKDHRADQAYFIVKAPKPEYIDIANSRRLASDEHMRAAEQQIWFGRRTVQSFRPTSNRLIGR